MSQPTTAIENVWNAIFALLQELQDEQVLGAVIEDDFKTGIFDRNIAAYPCAILTTPTIESTVDDSGTYNRTASFDVLIVQKGENVSSPKSIAVIQEQILDKFDNDPTLREKANGGLASFVRPAASPSFSVNSGDKTFIVFVVTLKCELFINVSNN